jgi:hypothetical protein
MAALSSGASAQALAGLAVDGILVARLGTARTWLQALRAAGASSEERILVSVLAAQLKAPTAPLVAKVRAGQTTWGQVLREAGLSPKDLDGLVRRQVALGVRAP